MTRIYVPVLIETVEQAEQLPVGTIIQCTTGPLESVPPYRKAQTGLWLGGAGPMSSDGLYLGVSARARCEWEALVPIEAKEQFGSSRPEGGAWECVDRSHAEDDAEDYARDGGYAPVVVSRYVTPWEEA